MRRTAITEGEREKDRGRLAQGGGEKGCWKEEEEEGTGRPTHYSSLVTAAGDGGG